MTLTDAVRVVTISCVCGGAGSSVVAAGGGRSWSCAWAAHSSGFSCCRARALGAQAAAAVAPGPCGAQALGSWRSGLVVPQQVGSSQTKN